MKQERTLKRHEIIAIITILFLLLLAGVWSLSFGETTPVTVTVNGSDNLSEGETVTINVLDDDGEVVASGDITSDDGTLVFNLIDGEEDTLEADGDTYVLDGETGFSPEDGDVSVTLVEVDDSDDSGDADDSKLE